MQGKPISSFIFKSLEEKILFQCSNQIFTLSKTALYAKYSDSVCESSAPFKIKIRDV